VRIAIVIPTYNEKENIVMLIPRIFSVMKKSGINGSVLIIDDNSPDGTYQTAVNLSRKFKGLKVIKRTRKLGLGSAYVHGFSIMMNKEFDAIMEMDADMSHNPEYIPDFVKALRNGDVIIGSRKITNGDVVGWNFYRKLVSNGGNLLARFFTGIMVKDMTSGYRAYKSSILRSVNMEKIKSNGYAFQIEMVYRCARKGAKVKEIPIVFIDRKFGKSKLSKKDMIEFLKTGIKIRLGLI
jgi:dolichol-phosphate mannosyltransferase